MSDLLSGDIGGALSHPPPLRAKVLVVAGEFILARMQPIPGVDLGERIVQGQIPADTCILDAKWDAFNQQLQLLLASEEFPEVPNDQSVPYLNPVYQRG